MMEILKQNASGLYLDIQKIGCFFRAALRMAEFVAESKGSSRRFTVNQINTLWVAAQKFGYINKDLNVVSSARIANMGLDYLKLNGCFNEVATFKDGKLSFYGSVPESKRRTDFFIQKIEQNGPSKTHFINVDKYGNLLWDPHDPEIKKQGIIYTICYRYDEV